MSIAEICITNGLHTFGNILKTIPPPAWQRCAASALERCGTVLLLGTCCGACLAVVLAWCGLAMAWHARPWVLALLYAPPVVLLEATSVTIG